MAEDLKSTVAAEPKEPTKQELLDALAKANDAIAKQNETIEQLKTQPRTPPPKAAKFTPRPYKGMVRAKEMCHFDYLHSQGDVFAVDVGCLWSDDPFEPVIVTGTDTAGKPIVEEHPDKPAAVHFRHRPKTDAALAISQAEPTRADQW